MEAGSSPAAALEPWSTLREELEAASRGCFGGKTRALPVPPPLVGRCRLTLSNPRSKSLELSS